MYNAKKINLLGRFEGYCWDGLRVTQTLTAKLATPVPAALEVCATHSVRHYVQYVRYCNYEMNQKFNFKDLYFLSMLFLTVNNKATGFKHIMLLIS